MVCGIRHRGGRAVLDAAQTIGALGGDFPPRPKKEKIIRFFE